MIRNAIWGIGCALLISGVLQRSSSLTMRAAALVAGAVLIGAIEISQALAEVRN